MLALVNAALVRMIHSLFTLGAVGVGRTGVKIHLQINRRCAQLRNYGLRRRFFQNSIHALHCFNRQFQRLTFVSFVVDANNKFAAAIQIIRVGDDRGIENFAIGNRHDAIIESAQTQRAQIDAFHRAFKFADYNLPADRKPGAPPTTSGPQKSATVHL